MLRCVVIGAAVLAFTASAKAQSSPPAAGEPPSCVTEFQALRQEVEKAFEAAKAGVANKLGARDMCRLMTQFTDADSIMIAYVDQKGGACGIPSDALSRMKAGHAKSTGFKKQACDAAAKPQPNPNLPPVWPKGRVL